jgi:MoaA/NifB/PqqE/SkfB family radical SAM enzyme
MYKIEEIKHVHLEISSRCNAACPLCPRNFFGYPYNDGYVEHDMTLAQAKQIFQPEFLKQITEVNINGNFGDAVMNHDTVAIVEYFKFHNPALRIGISTNGGARDRNFWQALARNKVVLDFCIDGIDEVHSLYRQNTIYSTVIKNAKIFIEAGGRAVWKMIDFDHNRHQQAQARQLSEELGFSFFNLVDHGRNRGPVFDKDKNLVHVMGTPHHTEQNFEVVWKNRIQDEVLFETISNRQPPRPISCEVKEKKSLYITSIGEVYPCCYLGFSPKTFTHGKGTYHGPINQQFRPLIGDNNALERPLADCISWFNKIVESWEIPTFEQGRLIICNDACGCKSNK